MIAAFGADLSGSLGGFWAGDVGGFVSLCATNRALVPVAVSVLKPLGLVSMLGVARKAAGIAISIAGIIESMSFKASLFLTARAGVPMAGFIFTPRGLIFVGDCPDCAADVAIDIAVILIGMLYGFRNNFCTSGFTNLASKCLYTFLLTGCKLSDLAAVPVMCSGFFLATDRTGALMGAAINHLPAVVGMGS